MRVSEGMPNGRFAELYHPDTFKENEEVIVFTRDEFSRMFMSMQEQMCHINKIYMHLDPSADWKLLGYWPKIMERIHLLDLNMELIFKNKPLQCYLDAYIYGDIQSSEREVAASKRKISAQIQLSI